MEAKCDGCAEYFAPADLRVYFNGTFWCDPCSPRPAKPILINYQFSWTEICALINYLDGSRDLDDLDTVDSLKKSLDWEVYTALKKVLRKDENGEVQEPN